MAGEFTRPGVFFREAALVPQITGVGVSTGAFVGVAERGPVDEAVLITSFSNYAERFGSFFGGSFLPHAVRAFFNEGGTRLFISRVVEPGAKASLITGTVPGDNAIQWEARFAGPAGNDISVELLDPSAAYSALSITVTGKKISVSLETGAGGALVGTATELIAAIAADEDASELVVLTDSGASTGTGTVDPLAETNLSGGAGAAVARRTFKDHDGTENALRVQATDPGAFGNSFSIDILKAETTTSEELVTASTEVSVASVVGFEVGDLVRIDDGTTSVDVIVTDINASTRELSFDAIAIGSPIASGATVQTATSHRVRTTLAAALADGDDRAVLTDATNAVAGQRLFFSDGAVSGTAIVDRVSGSTVFFTGDISLTSPLASGDIAVSLEFNITLKENGSFKEDFEFLSMENTNDRDWIGVRLSGDSNESLNIELVDLESGNSDALRAMPAPAKDVSLIDGDDGATPGASEFIGSSVNPKSGIFLFEDVIEDVNFIATPGIETLSVVDNGITFVEGFGDVMYIFATPESDDLPQEAIEYIERELNVDSAFAAVYYPHLKIFDPEDVDRIITQPPEGWAAGEWATVSINRGVHVAPANVPLRGVTDLTHQTAPGEHDLLNPRGINVIKSVRGRGIRILGARTLHRGGTQQKFINVRRLLNFIKRSLVIGNETFLFEPISDELFTDIRQANSAFLFSLWRDGALVPSNDPARAFFVKVDEETTPPDVQAQGRVNVEIGVNPSIPAETIVFTLSLFNGSLAIEESLA